MKLKVGYKLFLIFLLIANVTNGQKLERGFKALSEKDYFKSKRIFSKSMYGYPTTGAYGLSLMFYEQKNPFFNLDSALKYIVHADSAFAMADKKEQKMIQHFALSKEVISKHRLKIASRASQMLPEDATVEQYQMYLNKYSYATEFIEVVNKRDSVAFVLAKQADSDDAYREFIINYPGSLYRSEADSLYAKSFFRKKVGDGEVDAYAQFVKDFPASPYIEEAYDQIFSNVTALDTKEAYHEFVNEYPENAYTELAWKNLIGLTLIEDYSEKSLAKILADYPTNPLNHVVEDELKGYFISYFPVEIEDKWGYIRGDGALFIEPVYEEGDEFVEGLARVVKRGKNGFINKKGEVVITIEYDEVSEFHNGMSIVEKNEMFGVIDRRNKVIIPMEYDDIGILENDRILVEKGDMIGYFNAVGEQVIDFIYSNGVDFKNGLAVVKGTDKYGIIDVDNTEIVPMEYDWIESSEEDRIRVKQGVSFGLINRSGEILLPLEYDWIGPANKRNPMPIEKDGKVGYFSAKNEILVPPTYDVNPGESQSMVFKGKHVRVRQGGNYGVIDRSGTLILPLEYDTLGMPGENFVAFRNKGRWGFRELGEGTRIIEPRFDQVESFERGIAKVRVGDKFGVIDPNGIDLLRPEYASIINETTVGLLIVKKNGLMGLMDRDKNLIIGFKYNSIEIKNYRYVKCIVDDKTSFYDLQKNSFIWPEDKK